MNARWISCGARALLMAALAMVLETSCSHAPPRFDPREYEGQDVVVRFHATDGTTYVTSRYAVTDSSVVITQVLRDPKYYFPSEAKLYKQTLTPPPGDLVLPFELNLSKIDTMDRWEPRSAGKDLAIGGVMLAGIIVVAAAFAVYLLAKSF